MEIASESANGKWKTSRCKTKTFPLILQISRCLSISVLNNINDRVSIAPKAREQ